MGIKTEEKMAECTILCKAAVRDMGCRRTVGGKNYHVNKKRRELQNYISNSKREADEDEEEVILHVKLYPFIEI